MHLGPAPHRATVSQSDPSLPAPVTQQVRCRLEAGVAGGVLRDTGQAPPRALTNTHEGLPLWPPSVLGGVGGTGSEVHIIG